MLFERRSLELQRSIFLSLNGAYMRWLQISTAMAISISLRFPSFLTDKSPEESFVYLEPGWAIYGPRTFPDITAADG